MHNLVQVEQHLGDHGKLRWQAEVYFTGNALNLEHNASGVDLRNTCIHMFGDQISHQTPELLFVEPHFLFAHPDGLLGGIVAVAGANGDQQL